MERLRIAMVVPGLHGGGLERLVRDLSLELHVAMHQTVQIFSVGGYGVHAEPLQEAGILVRDCADGPLRIRGLPVRLTRFLSRFDPHIVHAHSGTWLPSAIAGSILKRRPLVYTEHGRYPPEPRWQAFVDRWCNHRTASLVAVSTAVARYLRDFLRLRVEPDVIHNGVNLDAYRIDRSADRTELRSSFGVGPNDTVLMSVGRLVPAKNHKALLDAFAIGVASNPHLHLVLVGEGPLGEELQSQARRLGIHGKLTFCGYRDDIARYLSAADCFVLSSKTEGQPISLLEAMAVGLPTISTNVGGVAEALGHPPAGLLAEPHRIEDFAQHIIEFAADGGLRSQLSAAARRRAKDFSITVIAKRYRQMYAGLAVNRLSQSSARRVSYP